MMASKSSVIGSTYVHHHTMGSDARLTVVSTHKADQLRQFKDYQRHVYANPNVAHQSIFLAAGINLFCTGFNTAGIL